MLVGGPADTPGSPAGERSRHALFRAPVSNPARACAPIADYLPREVVDLLDPDAPPEAIEGSFVDADAARTQCDALYKVKLRTGHEARIHALLEHKSYPDGTTPLQLLKYLVAIWQREIEGGTATDGLPPIIPLVLYHGPEEWTVPRSVIAQAGLGARWRGMRGFRGPARAHGGNGLPGGAEGVVSVGPDRLLHRHADARVLSVFVRLRFGRGALPGLVLLSGGGPGLGGPDREYEVPVSLADPVGDMGGIPAIVELDDAEGVGRRRLPAHALGPVLLLLPGRGDPVHRVLPVAVAAEEAVDPVVLLAGEAVVAEGLVGEIGDLVAARGGVGVEVPRLGGLQMSGEVAREVAVGAALGLEQEVVSPSAVDGDVFGELVQVVCAFDAESGAPAARVP